MPHEDDGCRHMPSVAGYGQTVPVKRRSGSANAVESETLVVRQLGEGSAGEGGPETSIIFEPGRAEGVACRGRKQQLRPVVRSFGGSRGGCRFASLPPAATGVRRSRARAAGTLPAVRRPIGADVAAGAAASRPRSEDQRGLGRHHQGHDEHQMPHVILRTLVVAQPPCRCQCHRAGPRPDATVVETTPTPVIFRILRALPPGGGIPLRPGPGPRFRAPRVLRAHERADRVRGGTAGDLRGERSAGSGRRPTWPAGGWTWRGPSCYGPPGKGVHDGDGNDP